MKALIAMSGGVDSAVAAYLTKAAGDDCIGCTMKLYENEDAGIPREHTCCSLDDVEDARSVAYRLGIPYYVFHFGEEFRTKVIDKFVSSYCRGETPNPCIDCNRYLKFDRLMHRAAVLGCDYVVTGHYARIEYTEGRYRLKKAVDEKKDQSYVLYTLTQEQLAHVRFPLGSMTKTETRRIAAEQGFLNAEKPDSQDICFVPDGDYAKVIAAHTGSTPQPGNFTDSSGNILGTHRGLCRYTIGQRRGLRLSFPEPRYVTALEPETNTVVLGKEQELYAATLKAVDFNWIAGAPPQGPIPCEAKIRYSQKPQPATAMPNEDGSVTVTFQAPQRAITPGQAVVLYDNDTVLGGGTIKEAFR